MRTERRSEPRTALMGERAQPLRPTGPGCDEPHRGCQTLPIDVDSWGINIIPRVAFYPLSDGPSVRNRGF